MVFHASYKKFKGKFVRKNLFLVKFLFKACDVTFLWDTAMKQKSKIIKLDSRKKEKVLGLLTGSPPPRLVQYKFFTLKIKTMFHVFFICSKLFLSRSSEFFQVPEHIWRFAPRFAFPSPRAYIGRRAPTFFQVPGLYMSIHRERTIFYDFHLASLNASLFLVPEPIICIEGAIFDDSHLAKYRCSMLSLYTYSLQYTGRFFPIPIH